MVGRIHPRAHTHTHTNTHTHTHTCHRHKDGHRHMRGLKTCSKKAAHDAARNRKRNAFVSLRNGTCHATINRERRSATLENIHKQSSTPASHGQAAKKLHAQDQCCLVGEASGLFATLFDTLGCLLSKSRGPSALQHGGLVTQRPCIRVNCAGMVTQMPCIRLAYCNTKKRHWLAGSTGWLGRWSTRMQLKYRV